MTISIENNKKKKRNLPRGILTPIERERLENGQITRQLRHIVKMKTAQALIVDLPLIFEKIEFDRYGIYGFTKTHYQAFIKLYFNLTKNRMTRQRLEQKVKRKVSDKMVWRQLIREVEDFSP
jgi:hypothetical protein